jgi:Protein of unknown function (DUF4058)
MDPYLESPVHWPDFHVRLVHALAESIGNALPGDCFAEVRQDTWLLEPLSGPSEESASGEANTSGDAAGPVTLENIELEQHLEPFVEIIRLPRRHVIATIKLLSPLSKSDRAFGQYARRRLDLLRQQVQLVELDLNRSGRRLALGAALPPAHYYVFVTRRKRPRECAVYPWTVRHRLPVIPIPLGDTDPAVAADIAGVFAAAYERGGYRKLIDYTAPPPPPPFGAEDADWLTTTARGGGGGTP